MGAKVTRCYEFMIFHENKFSCRNPVLTPSPPTEVIILFKAINRNKPQATDEECKMLNVFVKRSVVYRLVIELTR